MIAKGPSVSQMTIEDLWFLFRFSAFLLLSPLLIWFLLQAVCLLKKKEERDAKLTGNYLIAALSRALT